MGELMYKYKAGVVRIVDGDTFDLRVDMGFNLHSKLRFRLKDIDTPETWRPKTNAELRHGQKATEFVKKVMPEGSYIQICTHKDASIYGRYGVQITLSDGTDLAETLRNNNFEKKDVY